MTTCWLVLSLPNQPMNKKELTIEDILEKKSPDWWWETFAKKLERINKWEIKKHLSWRWIIDIYDDDESEYIYLDELIIKRFLQDTLPSEQVIECERIYKSWVPRCSKCNSSLIAAEIFCTWCWAKIKRID